MCVRGEKNSTVFVVGAVGQMNVATPRGVVWSTLALDPESGASLFDSCEDALRFEGFLAVDEGAEPLPEALGFRIPMKLLLDALELGETRIAGDLHPPVGMF